MLDVLYWWGLCLGAVGALVTTLAMLLLASYLAWKCYVQAMSWKVIFAAIRLYKEREKNDGIQTSA